jgi:hypothetical protein
MMQEAWAADYLGLFLIVENLKITLLPHWFFRNFGAKCSNLYGSYCKTGIPAILTI